MEPLLALGALVVGLVVGALVGLLAARRRPGEDPAVVAGRHEAALLRARAEGDAVAADLRTELAAYEATIDGLQRELAAAERRAQEERASRSAEAEARRQREQEESRVLAALAPVQETLRTVQGKVSELEQQRAAQYGALEQQLLATRASSEQVRSTAESLAAALRHNSMRGAWGETQLRRLVESAGLTNRVDFDLQVSTTTDEGTRRPDLVVRLPEGKAIAVDAKVPLAAFIEANEIPPTAVGAEAARRDALMKEHVKAVRAHIDALASKGYWTDFHSPEFVVAFLPSESLLSAALAADPSLLDHSFSKRVALASPVNLWAVLKTVAYTWTQQELTEDAHRLFTLSRTLYDRLAVLAQRAEKLRGALERTVTTYNEFAATLESRVLVTGRQINRMDESKILGEAAPLDAVPRPFTAPELAAAGDAA
ncbi:DNA recombination protein RmuC [Amnibacterium setariae]|uniref:DNA recombination protein RmuC n=1 Tax=Amnibacterium setariae TaxID=2306585 RepID=A0A3A1U3E6_9MICO|nr:DNA recombination protein RmuC [Amnibacterium setariae]RIX30912.1 DNA recombination protein RmuC [Amnibacterium setariae]